MSLFNAETFDAKAFGAKLFARSGGSDPPPVIPPTGLPAGGIGHGKTGKGARKRRRIKLPDGRIITPRDDAEYRAIVSAIISAEPVEAVAPRPRARKRLKGAVVAPEPVQSVAASPLPVAFYDALAKTHRSVIAYTQVLAAWEAYLAAEADDEETIVLLM